MYKRQDEHGTGTADSTDAAISPEHERWNQAIDQLAMASRKPQTLFEDLPSQLKLTRSQKRAWIPLEAPFEFVEIFVTEGSKFIVGLRGLVNAEMEKQAIELVPGDSEWALAIRTAAEKSRQVHGGRFMGRYVASAAQVFPNVYLFCTSNDWPDVDRDTFVMVCSLQPLNLNSLGETGDWQSGPFASLETNSNEPQPKLGGQMKAVLALAEGQVLTDDFAPVENLLIPVFKNQE